MRNWKQTLDWYESHNTAAQLGFDPEGMCLKICRTARGLPGVYPSAKIAQDATPMKFRVHKVSELRRGMVMYFDDPNDSNRFGHIVTMIGRVRGGDPDNLDHVLVETNSVRSNMVVVVRASYFKKNWGDSFKFGANWLNGQILDVPTKPEKKAKKPESKFSGPSRVDNFRESHPNWDVKILDRAIEGGRKDLKPKVDAIDNLVNALPDDKKTSKVNEVKSEYKRNRILKLSLLNEAVKEGRTGGVKEIRNKLQQVIKSLPPN